MTTTNRLDRNRQKNPDIEKTFFRDLQQHSGIQHTSHSFDRESGMGFFSQRFMTFKRQRSTELRRTERIVRLAVVRDRWQGWSQYELGHLHRAAKALRDAGFCVETDSGNTDEGEPWFLFWDADSCEVIVHVANIDRKYVVWFPNQNESFSGHNLPELIERLLKR